MDGLQKWLEKHHLEKWFRRDNLIILVLAGILLVVITLPTGKDSAQTESGALSGQSLWEGYSENGGSGDTGNSMGTSGGSYINSETNGSGAVSGIGSSVTSESSITSESSLPESLTAVEYTTLLEEKLAAILSKIQGVGQVSVMITLQESQELVVEKDLLENGEETIYETDSNASTPYVIKTIFPKVEGVVVVAEGAGTGKITQTITETVQALFDIELHKIKVAAG